mmetsp:Transcript_562/g.1045  ORF Transcript_562/g.1045 Transcript_562/m.1045 type:complete len:97 (-) Transcript_562:71-361(-)
MAIHSESDHDSTDHCCAFDSVTHNGVADYSISDNGVPYSVSHNDATDYSVPLSESDFCIAHSTTLHHRANYLKSDHIRLNTHKHAGNSKRYTIADN